MPVVSMQEVFESFGFAPDEARRMAGNHAAANGGMVVSGWVPDAEPEEEEDDDDNVDVLDMAEEARVRGDLKLCENTLLLCYIRSMNDAGLIVVKLRCLVRLGNLYHQKEDCKAGVEKYEEAFKMWNQDQWLADSDRVIHPVAFLLNWAECYERLGNEEEAAKRKA